MKIVTPPMKGPIASSLGASRNDGVGGTGLSLGGQGVGGKSAVDLSAAARQLASLGNSDNDINLERVQQLRDAIASGQLKIDASRIADGIIASARDLLK